MTEDTVPIAMLPYTTKNPTPQTVKICKARLQKLNWKKGGHNVAEGVTNGFRVLPLERSIKTPEHIYETMPDWKTRLGDLQVTGEFPDFFGRLQVPLSQDSRH